MPVALGGDERLEQLRRRSPARCPGRCRRPRSRPCPSASGRAAMASSRARRVLHGLDRVAHQVEQDLLDLHLVDQHQVDLRVEVEADAHAMLLGADQGQRAGLLDQLRQALDPPLGLAAGDELAQPADDLRRPAAPARRPCRARRRTFSSVAASRGRAASREPLQVVGDRRQRLVELVRQRRGHLAHRGEARDVDQLALQLLQPRARSAGARSGRGRSR